jgi:cell division protein FtsB
MPTLADQIAAENAAKENLAKKVQETQKEIEDLNAKGIDAPITDWDSFSDQFLSVMSRTAIAESDQRQTGLNLGNQLIYYFITNPDIPVSAIPDDAERRARNMKSAAVRLNYLIRSCIQQFPVQSMEMSNFLHGLGIGLRSSELLKSSGGAQVMEDTAFDIEIAAIDLGEAYESTGDSADIRGKALRALGSRYTTEEDEVAA